MNNSGNTVRLPENELNRIKKVLICYDDVPSKISYREYWEEKEKGGLRELLQDFYNHAQNYELEDEQIKIIGKSLANVPVKVNQLQKLGNKVDQTLESEIMEYFLEIRTILVPLYPDYSLEKHKMISPLPISRTSKTDIVYEFYEVLEHLIDLRDAMIIYLQQRRYAGALSNYFNDVLGKLEERLNILIEDIKKYRPIDDKELERIHNYCMTRIDDLHICFGCKTNSYDDKRLQEFFYDMLRSSRTDIRKLWNDYLRHILQEESGATKW